MAAKEGRGEPKVVLTDLKCTERKNKPNNWELSKITPCTSYEKTSSSKESYFQKQAGKRGSLFEGQGRTAPQQTVEGWDVCTSGALDLGNACTLGNSMQETWKADWVPINIWY